MARVVYNQPIDLLRLELDNLSVTSASSTQVVLSDGVQTVVLTGSITFDGNGVPNGGTLDSLAIQEGSVVQVSADQLNYPVEKLLGFVETDNLQGGLADALSGADSIYGSSGSDVLYGFAGNDFISEEGQPAGADTVFAGLGADTIFSGQGDDLVFGGLGDDADVLRLGQGSDRGYGGGGDDTLDGGAGDDTIGGGLGADSIDAGSGNDVVFGGDGDFADRVRGGGDNDVIYVGAGADTVTGNEGNDTIGGGAGADVLRGGSGDDVIYLGRDDGAADTFQTGSNDGQGGSLGNGNDTVYAFENGRDHIDVSGSGITQFSQLGVSAAADGDAIITLASGQTVTLDGVSVGQIDATDFVFA